MTKLPKSRQSEVVVQTLGKEMLIYDLKAHRAFQLNETSMIVFQACAEGQTFEDLKRRHKFTEDLIDLTLDTLARENLLVEAYQSKLAGLSRREAIRRVGLATMIALPLIAPLIAPKAADAASAVNQCRTNSCVDRNPDCNNGSPCSALGAGFVCCAAFNSCSCAPAAVCTGNGGQICP